MNKNTPTKPTLNVLGLHLSKPEPNTRPAGVREDVENAVSALKEKGLSHREAWGQVKKRKEFKSYFEG